VAVCAALPALAFASSIVANGGFETGNFSGWSLGMNTFGTGVCAAGGSFLGAACGVESGMFAAVLGPSNVPGTLSQALATLPNTTYALSFSLRVDSLGQVADNMFSVSWGGNTLLGFANVDMPGYWQLSFPNVFSTGTSTELQFVLLNNPGGFFLDDVSVTAVGTPAGGTGGGGDIANGGFETGDFTGWAQGGNTFGTGVCASGSSFIGALCTVHSGMFAAVLGPSGTPGTLSQTVTSQDPGLAFWLRTDNLGQAPNNQFSVLRGGTTLLGMSNANIPGYAEFRTTGLSAENGTEVKFVVRNDPGGFFLDDVSTVPEASSVVLAAAGLSLLFALKRRPPG